MAKRIAVILSVLAVVVYACSGNKKTAATAVADNKDAVLSGKAPDGKPYNILFIPVDDLNHWIAALGRNAQVKTPNMDRLAKSGVMFSAAQCAAPQLPWRPDRRSPKDLGGGAG